jgi:toxin FitB
VILVDTNVWSELSKRNGDRRVIEWLGRNEPQLHLSVLVIAEIRAGYENPRAQAIRSMLERWLASLEMAFVERTENFDTRDAHVYGQIAARRTIGSKVVDIQLAAQAIARNGTLATRNVRDVAWTGARLVNPWEA